MNGLDRELDRLGRRAARVACPRCGARETLPMMWGYPIVPVGDAAERGEVRLGGCMIFEEPEPDFSCGRCGLEWHRAGRARFTWTEGDVDARADRIELRHARDPSVLAALVGPPVSREFPALLLTKDPVALGDVRRDLDLYLTKVGCADPWSSVIYHCVTLAGTPPEVQWHQVAKTDESIPG